MVFIDLNNLAAKTVESSNDESENNSDSDDGELVYLPPYHNDWFHRLTLSFQRSKYNQKVRLKVFYNYELMAAQKHRFAPIYKSYLSHWCAFHQKNNLLVCIRVAPMPARCLAHSAKRLLFVVISYFCLLLTYFEIFVSSLLSCKNYFKPARSIQ